MAPHFTIPGVDVQKGVALVVGLEEVYREALEVLLEDIEERLPPLQNTENHSNAKLISLHAHALKSASASIGAEQMHLDAQELEAEADSNDFALIGEKLPAFLLSVEDLYANIKAALRQ